MEAFAIFSSLSVIVALALYLVKRKYSYWKELGVPCLSPTFPFGNIKGIGRDSHVALVMEKLYNKLKSSDSLFAGIFVFLSPVVLVTSLDFVRTVLVKDSANFIDRGAYYNQEDGEQK